jgi:hypothetical protein
MSAEFALDAELVPQPTDAFQPAVPLRGQLIAFEADGTLRVKISSGVEFVCAWLETSTNLGLELSLGDALLVLPPSREASGIVLGRIGLYRAPQPVTPQPHVTIEATETLTLKCGDATVDLRKDGKLMIRGDDVLLRAKGTQRIKAGTVAIN